MPADLWEKLGEVYASMPYWAGNKKWPCWKAEHIDWVASVEPSRIQIYEEMPEEIWENWYGGYSLDMEKKITGAEYLYLALYAFAGIGLELVLVGVTEAFFGIILDTYTASQNIIHWIATCIIWMLAGIFLINLAKRKYNFDLWEHKNKLKGWQYLGIVICLIVSIASHYMDWGGFKPVIELQKLGLLKFVFQYIYYLFEAFLISLIIIFGQKACEKWFKNEYIPYGGVVLALTWGLMHIASKGSIAVGLLSAFGGFLYGAAYLVVGKDYRKALPLMCFMFVL